MSDPPPTPDSGAASPHQHGLHLGHHHGHKHVGKPSKRPEGSRHSSDWISRLHRRHDAKHHGARDRAEEEAPLLAQEAPGENEAHDEEVHLRPRAAERMTKPVRDCFSFLKKVAKRAASLASNGAQTSASLAISGTKAFTRGTSNVAKKGARKVRKSPGKVMSVLILLLLITNTVLGVLFGLHLATDKENKACSSPSCIRAANSILRNLKPNLDAGSEDASIAGTTIQTAAINPCIDFDKLVCGGFKQHHDLRSEQGHLDAGTIIAAKVDKVLRDSIEKPKTSGGDKAIHKKMKDHYTACMAEEEVAQKGLKPLQDVAEKIKDLMGKHDPVLPGSRASLQVSTAAIEIDVEALTDTLAYMTQVGVPALVDFYVGIDEVIPSKQAIFASAVQAIGLGSPKLYQDVKILAEYRAVAEEVLKHFFDAKLNTTHALHLYPRQKPRMRAILDLAQGVVDFEVKLAMITPSKDEEMDITTSYNKMTMSELETTLPQISVPRLIKALAPGDYSADSVFVSSPNFLAKLKFLLQMTHKEVLTGFYVWKIVQQYANRVEDPALKPLKDFNAKMRGSRVDQPPERWRQCVQSAKEDLSWISAWFFLKGKETDLKKRTATDIARKVGDAFGNMLKKTKWMAEEDSEKSADKVKSIHQEIGHPKKMDASSLDKYYSRLTIKADTYFENKVSAANFEVQKSWAKLAKATQSKEWDVTPLSTKPDYGATLNRLLLPEALLHAPISYDNSVPDYVVFGSFGAISGHGISRSVGPVGSYYSKNGTFSDSWSKTTREAFEKKAQCFVDQFSEYTVIGPDGKTNKVNGNLTLAENMADAAGAEAAFRAWKEHEKKHPGFIVPGLEKYTRDQVFWLSFGSTLCSITTKEKAVQHVHSSPRAPGRVRILGTVANSKGFLEAFKCPKQPKCDLW